MLGGWFVGLIFRNGRHPAMLALRERTVPKKSSPKKCTFAHHNKGLELTEDTVIGRFVTARLEVDFKKSLPMNEEITVISVAEEVGERKVIVNMEMEAGGVIRAKARMVAVGVKDTM